MSHYTVAIITKGKPTGEMIDKLMAPYQENNVGDCPKEYLKFNGGYKWVKVEYIIYLGGRRGNDREKTLGKYRI